MKLNIFKIILFIIWICILYAVVVFIKNNYPISSNLITSDVMNLWPSPSFNSVLPKPSPSPVPIKINRLKIQRKPTVLITTPFPSPSPSPDDQPWGVAKQLTEHTWTIKVQQDEQMTTREELFAALNDYRKTKGSASLQYDAVLADYAQSRAEYFNSIQKTDEHAGFNEYLKDDENFKKLGFASLGENSAWGYKMTGVHLIEWIYASDAGHDNNQTDPDWTHVGIGISGTASELIFAGNKL